MKFDIGGSIEKIQVSLKSDKNNGYMYIYDIKLNSLTMRNVSDKVVDKSKTHIEFFYNEECVRQSCRQKQNTYFMFNNFFF